MERFPPLLLAHLVWLAVAGIASADEPVASVAFNKILLTDKFNAEGSGIGDIDKDGNPDAVYGPYWYAGPAFTGEAGDDWEQHRAFPTVDNESPQFADLTGDGKPELLFHTGGVLGLASPTDATGTDRWAFTRCSEKHAWGPYTHGLGCGDVNGDGRADLVIGNKRGGFVFVQKQTDTR